MRMVIRCVSLINLSPDAYGLMKDFIPSVPYFEYNFTRNSSHLAVGRCPQLSYVPHRNTRIRPVFDSK